MNSIYREKREIRCVSAGIISGLIIKSSPHDRPTKKIIVLHGWLDNLNSMVPLAEKLAEHHEGKNTKRFDVFSSVNSIFFFEITNFFSSTVPVMVNRVIFRKALITVQRIWFKVWEKSSKVSRTARSKRNDGSFDFFDEDLGWTKENYALIGHSYGAMIIMIVGFVFLQKFDIRLILFLFQYAACFSDEVSCVVAIDALPRVEVSPEQFWKVHGERIDEQIEFQTSQPRKYENRLTLEKAIDL